METVQSREVQEVPKGETQLVENMPSAVPTISEIGKLKNGNYKLLIIAAAATFVFLLGLALSFSLIASRVRTILPSSTPTPVPTSQPISQEEITNPSRYATDSAVLKIKTDLDNLDRDLNTVDLNENSLRPPDIQFDESF